MGKYVLALALLSSLSSMPGISLALSCPEPLAGKEVSGTLKMVQSGKDGHPKIYIEGYPGDQMSLPEKYGLNTEEGKAFYAIILTAYANHSWVKLYCDNGEIQNIEATRTPRFE
ncbi:hypothetical protein ACEK07_04670 [Alcanivoracaceae bacterium MT1]